MALSPRGFRALDSAFPARRHQMRSRRARPGSIVRATIRARGCREVMALGLARRRREREMRIASWMAATSLLLAGCGGDEQPGAPANGSASAATAPQNQAEAANPAAGAKAAERWVLQPYAGGSALALVSASGGDR